MGDEFEQPERPEPLDYCDSLRSSVVALPAVLTSSRTPSGSPLSVPPGLDWVVGSVLGALVLSCCYACGRCTC